MAVKPSGATGGGGVLPASKFPGDLLVGTQTPAGGWADGSAPNLFQSQATWFVDSAAGNDANDGLTALTALKTIENLSLRLASAILQQNTTITLSGSFTGQTLWLPRLAAGFNGTVVGTPVTAHAGAITAKTDFVAGATWPNFTDGAIVDVAPYVNKRIRLTAGAALAWAFIEVKLAATRAEVSQWNVDGVVTNATLDTYLIEDLTPVGEVFYDNPDPNNGAGTWTVRDCDIYKARVTCADPIVSFVGCRIGNSTAGNIAATQASMAGSYFVEPTTMFGTWSLAACGSASGANLSVRGAVTSTSGLYQDQIAVAGGGALSFVTDNGIENATIADAALVVAPGATAHSASGALWGANAGVAYGARVDGGGKLVADATKPTLAGAADAIFDGVAVTWATVQALIANTYVDADGASLEFLPWMALNTGATNAIRFLALGGNGNVASSVGACETEAPFRCRLVAIRAFYRGGALAAANTTYTLVRNEVATATTLAVPATQQSGDTIVAVAIAKGDRFGVQSQTDAADATTSFPCVTLVLRH